MIDYNTFHNNMIKTKEMQTTSHELSNAIDCLIVAENDDIRCHLFKAGETFYKHVTETLAGDYIWPADQTRIDFEEFIEYLNNDRELMVNWLIETELEYIHSKIDEQNLRAAIEKIQEFDRRYMIMLLDNRATINRYV